MELKQIKELMSSMKKEGIKKVFIKEKTGFEVQIESQGEPTLSATHSVYYPSMPQVMQEQEIRHSLPVQREAIEEKAEGCYVTSPLVGTFYSSSSPDDPSFVKVGDRVDENTVVCIIEAMKVMNEVKAGVSGIVAEILIENAHPVEFGTKVFRIV